MTNAPVSDALPIARPGVLLLILAALTGTAVGPDPAQAATGSGPSSYRVTMLRLAPPRFAVRARLPIDGVELELDTTRPAGFFQALWRQTEQGRRPYGWGEIRAALETTATRDWEAYFLAHVRGNEPLPLAEVLALAGLRLEEEDGVARITEDPAVPASARSLWRTVIERR